MNSKKNKKNVNIEDSNTVKKTKKTKIESTNENLDIENRTRKRKNAESDIVEAVPSKKTKKKNKSAGNNNKDLLLPNYDIENIHSIKKQKNGHIVNELEVSGTNIAFDEVPTKGKKKKNVKKEIEEFSETNLDLDVSTTSKSSKTPKGINSIQPECLDFDVSTTSKSSKTAKGINSIKSECLVSDVFTPSKSSKSPKGINLIKSECLDLDVSTTSKSPKTPKGINSMKLDCLELDNALINCLHHEVNIVDINAGKVNEGDENVVTISIKDEGLDSDWDENDLLKQLERRIEKKESPKERKGDIEWSDSDLNELIERMEVTLPENDLKPYMKRAETIDWDKIAFKNYTADDCKKTWSLVLKKLRRYRILKEVLQDAKQWILVPRAKKKIVKYRHPDMPRRPLSAYFIYYLKKKDSLQAEHPGLDATELAKMCSQKFKVLAPEKRLKYENIANKNKEEYDQKMKDFYEIHPELKPERDSKSKRHPKLQKLPKPPKPVVEKPPPKPPKPPKEKLPKRPLSAFQYYQMAEASKEQVEDKAAFREFCKEKWKQMPDDKKIEWISFAEAETLKYEDELKEYIKNHPEYIHTSQSKPQLTKEELLVKERISGKPPKPPVSAYNLFSRLMMHSDDIKTVPVKERLVFVSNQWKECTEEEKKNYKELFDKAIEKYNKDFATYLESLPEEERKLELLKNGPKRRKSEDEKRKKESKGKKVVKKKPAAATEIKKPVVNKANSSSKKTEKKPRKLVEPEQPPISPFKYFASTYNGEEPAAKAWKALASDEKKRYEEELVQKKKAYILDFEKFLKSMTKEELENFSNCRKKQNNQKASEEDDDDDDDEDETSDQSDSEEDSNDEDSEEEKDN